jgi:NAD(P)-dependent dehydrogenase (short-subunit alcohol dehydrogenase family)
VRHRSPETQLIDAVSEFSAGLDQFQNDRDGITSLDSPMQRPAQPAELAPAFVFLASHESSYVNGEVLGVSGGKPLA